MSLQVPHFFATILIAHAFGVSLLFSCCGDWSMVYNTSIYFYKAGIYLFYLTIPFITVIGPSIFPTNFVQGLLIVKRKQRVLMWVYIGSAILNIVLNLVFIPLYSSVASAIITGVCEAIVLVLLFIQLRRIIHERS